MAKEVWMNEKFARIAGEAFITVSVEIALADETRTVEIRLPNLQTPRLQQLGAGINDNFGLYLLLGNGADEPTRSEPVALFCE